MGIAEQAEAMYRQYMDDDDLAIVESLDAPDRAYFWSRLYYEIPRRMNRQMLEEMERSVLKGMTRKRVVVGLHYTVAKTLDDLWDTTKPHAWFKAVIG